MIQTHCTATITFASSQIVDLAKKSKPNKQKYTKTNIPNASTKTSTEHTPTQQREQLSTKLHKQKSEICSEDLENPPELVDQQDEEIFVPQAAKQNKEKKNSKKRVTTMRTSTLPVATSKVKSSIKKSSEAQACQEQQQIDTMKIHNFEPQALVFTSTTTTAMKTTSSPELPMASTAHAMPPSDDPTPHTKKPSLLPKPKVKVVLPPALLQKQQKERQHLPEDVEDFAPNMEQTVDLLADGTAISPTSKIPVRSANAEKRALQASVASTSSTCAAPLTRDVVNSKAMLK